MPGITEAKLYEAFGLTAPETGAAGATEQGAAAPAAESAQAQSQEGANEQAPAEPAAGTEQGSEGNQEPSQEGQSEPSSPETEPMSQEERHRNAARRRAQEQQAAVDQAVSAALETERQRNAQSLESFFAGMGIKNTFTGEPIKTMEEFNAWKSQYDADQFGKDLKAGKATPEQFNQMIDNHPVVKQAQQVISQSQEAQRKQAEKAAQQKIEADISEISKLNPQIKTVADLLAMPRAEDFKAYVARGNDFLSAYKLACFEELTQAKAERAAQQAVNQSRGKDHLVSSSGTGSAGSASVPSNVMAMYRAFNPKATDEQIRAHYNKTMKKS